MSYSVSCDTTTREEIPGGQQGVSVTTFAGGPLGPMVQLTIGGKYVEMTRAQLRVFIGVCEFAEQHSLVHHPANSWYER